MKKMISLAVVIGLAAFLGFQAYAAEAANPESAVKVAFVDVNKVAKNSSVVAKAGKKLQAKFKSRQDKLMAAQKTFKANYEAYNKNAAVMSDKDKKAKEDALTKEGQALRKQTNAYQADFVKAQMKSLNSIMDKIKAIASKMAKKNGYSLVLAADSRNILYAGDGVDITGAVQKSLDS